MFCAPELKSIFIDGLLDRHALEIVWLRSVFRVTMPIAVHGLNRSGNLTPDGSSAKAHKSFFVSDLNMYKRIRDFLPVVGWFTSACDARRNKIGLRLDSPACIPKALKLFD